MFQSTTTDTEQSTTTEAGAEASSPKGRRYRGVQRDEEVVRVVLDSVRTGTAPPEMLIIEARDALPRWMTYRGIEVEALRGAGVPDDMLQRLGLIPGDIALGVGATDGLSPSGEGGPDDERVDHSVASTGYVPQPRGPSSSLREMLIEGLASYPGGRLADPSGLTNGLLRERMAYQGSPMNVSRMLAVLESDGLLTRVIFGKRCPVIELTEQGLAVAAVLEARRLRDAELAAKVAEKQAPAAPSVPNRSFPLQRAAEHTAPGSSYIPPLSERWASRNEPREFPIATTDSDSELSGLSDEDVSWELEGRSSVAPNEELTLRRRIRDLSKALEREQALTADLRERLVVVTEDRTDLRIRLSTLEDDVAMYKSRADQLEKNLDVVMKGPDRTIERQLETRRLSNIISSRPG